MRRPTSVIVRSRLRIWRRESPPYSLAVFGLDQRAQHSWHGRNADKSIYREGNKVSIFSIENCSYGYLVCGDLFDDKLITAVKESNPDVVIVPIARSSDNELFSQELWDNEEKPYYVDQVKKLKTRVLMTNYINEKDSFFGGAFVINADGIIEKQKEINEEGILYWESGSI